MGDRIGYNDSIRTRRRIIDDELAERVEGAIRGAWSERDPHLSVACARRGDGKLDVTVISRLFESRTSEEREILLWSVLRSFPADDSVRMTYSLLLSPAEAATFSPTSIESGVSEGRKETDWKPL